MGTKSDYVAGTITVTQGSAEFTGTGTLWRVMGFQEGDTVLLKGYQMVIDAGNVGSGLETQLITSNTSGTFTEEWPGESGTFFYRMRWQSNDSRLSAKVSDFLLRTASGNITAIGELEGVENTLIRFTGPATVELIDQDEIGIQDPNGNLADFAELILNANKILNTDGSGNLTQSDISSLGLDIIGKADGQSVYSSIGAIPDPQLPVGMVRMLLDGPIDNLNTILENGTFLSSSASTNAPIASSGFIVMMRQTANFGRQIYYQRDGSRMFTRNWTNGVWGAWTEIGGGSVTGSGWIRLPSGLIIQWGTTIVTTTGSNLGIIPLNITFPSNLYTSIIVNGDWGVSAARPQGFVVYPPSSNTSQIAFACGVTSGNVRANWIAMGA